MRRLLITFIVLLLVVSTVFAHDGTDHASELEQWVDGIGILLILMSCVYTFFYKLPNEKKRGERKHIPRDPNTDNTE